MNLTELLKMRGFDTTQAIKVIRHQNSACDTTLLYKKGMLEFYQSIQHKHVFKDCDYILSFLGDVGRKAVFVGAYRKINYQMFDPTKIYIPQDYPYPETLQKDRYFYTFEKIDLLTDLIDRLVINWGTRIWHNWLKEYQPREVVEILPKGYTKDFPGFLELIVSFEELSKIILNPDAHRIWHTMLSSVAGIYLILDGVTGNQYVGSAYGQNGILGRWRSYVETQHGNNLSLIQLLQIDPNRHKTFQFSILHTLPISMTPVQVIAYENIYKQKLGSRAFGLNAN
ncbi:GIY-YIG nuclease family protein [Paenibacillus sp. FSL R5-0908]|nr:hypothetical protein BSK60_13965 [Paenibacillus odorifer]